MDNNDILRKLKYALNIDNSAMVDIFKLTGHEISESTLLDILKKEKDKGYIACSDRELVLFLDGLIIKNRGKKVTIEVGPTVKPEVLISNNIVLKKLRIALDFKENDMLEIFKLSGCEITKLELSALFRKEGNKHYKICGDQMMSNFLKGLTVHFRK